MKNILILGSSGRGKTHLAEIISKGYTNPIWIGSTVDKIPYKEGSNCIIVYDVTHINDVRHLLSLESVRFDRQCRKSIELSPTIIVISNISIDIIPTSLKERVFIYQAI